MKATGLLLALVSACFFAPAIHAYPVTFYSQLTPETAGATGSGEVTLIFDDAADSLSIFSNWSGLSGTTTVAHIHCCTATPGTGTAGVAVTPGTLPGFPVGLMTGTYDTVLNLALQATYTTGFFSGSGGTIPGAKAALLAGLYDGTAYFNIHTSVFAGGEIRGFPQPVPEPLSAALLGIGLFVLWMFRRRRTV